MIAEAAELGGCGGSVGAAGDCFPCFPFLYSWEWIVRMVGLAVAIRLETQKEESFRERKVLKAQWLGIGDEVQRQVTSGDRKSVV